MTEQQKQGETSEEVRGEAKEKLGQAMGDEDLDRQGRMYLGKSELKDACEEAISGLCEAAG